MIHQLREQGESITAIAKRAGLDRKTVRKYLKRGVESATYGPRAPRPRVIDPYRAYVRERLERYPKLSAMRLLREVRALGYRGGRTAVTDYVAEVRPREGSVPPPSDRGNSERGRVVVTPDVDPRFVASHVIDAVGNRFARRVLGKVVHQ